MNAVEEIDAVGLESPETFREKVARACRPVVLRGLARDWPVTRAGADPAALRAYLGRFDAGRSAELFLGDPAIRGRYYYGEGLEGFNFERRPVRFAEALDRILADAGGEGAPSAYLGSLPVEDYLPGFAAENRLALMDPAVGARIWLGHAATVSCHYDTLDNLACVVAGERRFTLYPPDAIGDLYVGPIDHTMAGQPVSLAASSPPDEARFPRFAAARARALAADLGPGDALYLPKLWWHQVESTASWNGLVNYWWDAFGAGPDAPYAGLLLSMIAICERPEAERRAWAAFFDHYVFRPKGHPLAHLPPDRHGLLGPLKPHNYGRIRTWVMHMLRR